MTNCGATRATTFCTANRGNDTLLGGEGMDRFAFADGSGQDRIADYDPTGGDVIRLEVGPDGLLNGVAIASFADIQERLTDGPDGAILDLGDGNSVTIAGIAKDQLPVDDFMII